MLGTELFAAGGDGFDAPHRVRIAAGVAVAERGRGLSESLPGEVPAQHPSYHRLAHLRGTYAGMSDSDNGDVELLEPVVVEYHPAVDLPPEYCEYLPKADFEKCLPWLIRNRDTEWLQANCKNYAATFSGENEAELKEKLEKLCLEATPKEGDVIKKLPGGKVKKKEKAEILIERSVRNKKKCITTVSGLETFGIKNAEASKVFGKKFACGASVTKNAMEKEQIDIQGDFQEDLAELIVSKWKDVSPKDIYFKEKEKRTPYQP